MRATSRLLAAAARPAARYLEPGTPTGLTGLATHSSPRATLLYLYTATLEKLRRGVPEHSVYRQSVEALTRQRLALVEATVPPGYDEWAARARRLLREHPEQFSVEAAATRAATGVLAGGSPATVRVDLDGDGDGDGDGSGGRTFVVARLPEDVDVRYLEWDGEVDEGPEPEGSRTLEEREGMRKIFQRRDIADQDAVEWEPEPPLTADQIAELENKIGAGLIEEVIQVAEGELKLVDTMIESKVWEPLEEQPPEGQWVYFDRKP